MPDYSPDYSVLELSPSEQRLFDILADGEMHTKRQLIIEGLQGDELTSDSQLYVKLSNLRKKLRAVDEDILAQHIGKGHTRYRRIRLLVSLKSKA